MEDGVGTLDRPAQPVAVRQVALDELCVEMPRAAARAHERDHLVALLSQLPHQPPAEEPCGAGDERSHFVGYFIRSATSCATSVGVVPTWIPRASSASFFACAVPEEPEMIAPACPIVFPGGAEKPAM